MTFSEQPTSLRVTPEADGGRVADDDPRSQIAQLEARIEELAETMRRCGKIILFSKIVIVAGGVWVLGILLGLVGADPLALMGALSLLIGGTVVFGSNTATAKQLLAAMHEAETTRHELISALGLRVVGGSGAPRGQ